MRRLFVGGLAGLVLVTAAMMTGCDSKSQTATPATVEPPKEGPQPIGGTKGKGGANNSAD